MITLADIYLWARAHWVTLVAVIPLIIAIMVVRALR